MAKPVYMLVVAAVIGIVLALSLPVFATADYGAPENIDFTAEFETEGGSTSVGGSDLSLTLTDTFNQNDDIRIQILDRTSEESDTYRYTEGETRNITFEEYSNLSVTYVNYDANTDTYTVNVFAEFEKGLMNEYGYTIPIIIILIMIAILVEVLG